MPELKTVNARALRETLVLLGGEVLVSIVTGLTDALDRAERTGYEDGYAYGFCDGCLECTISDAAERKRHAEETLRRLEPPSDGEQLDFYSLWD